jgi:streptogramin lyase
MKRFALPIAILAVVSAACGSSGAVGVGTVKKLVPLPKVLPNSVVRIDPRTLKPLQVVSVGSAPDLVVASGGFVWVTHHVLRDVSSGALRNRGDRKLTQVNPATGKATDVGNGLAPCGLAADPSGDVWVANCFEPGLGQTRTIVRVNAKTLGFTTWPVPGGSGFYRGLAYGGGSIWVSDGGAGHAVTRVNPKTGAKKVIRLDRSAGGLAWSKAHGNLWVVNFDAGSLTRLHAATGASEIVDHVAVNPVFPAVAGDTVWAGDWSSRQVVRLHAVGSPRPRTILLPAVNSYAGVWDVAVGAGYVWATTPRDDALWRINPRTNAVTRVSMPHPPAGVTVNANQVWVTVGEK